MSFAPTSRSHSAAQSYAKVGVETGVAAADSHRLILMLFDGALLAVAKAGSAMEQKRIAEKGQIISHAIDIIANGLKASLNFAAGDELANRLAALYDYMCNRLICTHHEPTRSDDDLEQAFAAALEGSRRAGTDIGEPEILLAREGLELVL